MNKLRDNLYIGNARDGSFLLGLRDNKITAILNVAYEVNDPIYDPKEIRSVKIGLLDSGKNKPYIKDLAIAMLISLLKEGEIVLVHCGAGLSRSVFVTCFALQTLEKIEAYDIFQEIRNIKPFAQKGELWLGYGYKPIGADELGDN